MLLPRFLVAACAASLALSASPAHAQLAGKRVLFVNSYHEGYPWADGEEKGARMALQNSGAKLDFVRMDVKRHQGDTSFAQAAASKVKAQIEATKPDAVIVADDPAVQLVLVPYFNNSAIPFVFCGVNWDAAKYGLGKNVTGMVEVSLVKEMLASLKDYAKGQRLGFLTADAETEHIEGPYYRKALSISFTREHYAKTLAEWKTAFLEMQRDVDVLFIGPSAGINDWNDADADAFVQANSKIPSSTIYDFMMPFAMVGYTKIAEEQGAWAGKTALEILGGKTPASIPVAANKQAKIYINAKLAGRAGIVFRPELVKVAEVVK